MRRRSGVVPVGLCVLSATVLCWGLAAGAGASQVTGSVRPQAVATPAPPPPPAGRASPAWGHAGQAPGIATLDHSGGGALEAIACPAKGACTAGGFYSDGASKKQQGFVIDEVGGLWEAAQDVPLVPQLNTGGTADVLAVGCLAAGECGAGGFYRDATGLEAFIGSEVSSTWDGSIELPGSGGYAQVDAEACPAFARCVVGGYIADTHGNRQPFVDEQSAGTWPTAVPVPGNLNKGSIGEVTSLSCTSLGSCVASGFYTDAKFGRHAFVVTEAHGDWGPMQNVAGSLNKGDNAQVNQVSCGVSPKLGSIITCAAVGYYTAGNGQGRAFTATMANGTWGPAVQVPGSAALDKGGFAQLNSVSCPTAGNCSAGGSYAASKTSTEPFVVTERNGTWGKAIEVPGSTTLNTGNDMSVTAVSCVSPGLCSATGDFRASKHSESVWAASQNGGRWGQAGTIPGLSGLAAGSQAEVNGLSCATSGSCGLVGDYFTTTSQQPFVVSGSVDAPTATTMARSAVSVVYGREQAERVSVNVDDVFGSAPTGTVTIKAGKHVACTITLKARNGSCTVPSTRFGPGTIGVTAFYNGGISFQASHSAAQTFTVLKATTKTRLALSTSSVTYGHEQAERLSVAVTPQFAGTPAGTVSVKSGTRTICTFVLRSGKGSCALTAKQLRPGTYRLTASYPGKGGFTGSTSASRTLRVANTSRGSGTARG
jgi:Bacterial Ig-like domain (group 3)